MRDIYLIDFENVASEGLSGITYLSPEDQVIIFYSTNSNRLSMKMHILIGKSTCKLSYFEVSVGGKNALDHQISTWLGYLIGVNAAERGYYIVSRDMGYRHVANFWAVNDGKPRVKCVETIRAAVRLERIRQEKEAQGAEIAQETLEQPADPTVPVPVQAPAALLAVTEPVLALKAAEVIPAAQPEAQETTAQHAEPQIQAPAEVEPLESLEDPDPEPGRKSYRGRTRFRRNRGRGHGDGNKPENREPAKQEPQPVHEEKPQAEVHKADKPEPRPVEQPKAETKPVPKAEPQPKAEVKPEPKPAEQPQEKKPAHSERYSSSFWRKPPEEIKRSQSKAEPKPEVKQEPKQEQKTQVKAEPKPQAKAEPKAEAKAEQKAQAKPELKTEAKAEQKLQAKPEPKAEAKPEAKTEPKPQSKPEQKAEPEKKPEHAEAKEKPQGRQKRAPKGDKPNKAPAKQETHDLSQLTRLIAPYPELQEAALKELVLANKRQVLCNALRKQLGQEKGLALYNELKKSAWK